MFSGKRHLKSPRFFNLYKTFCIVVFQDNKKVRRAWREYLNSLHEKSPHFDSSNSFKLDLLSEMAVALGYKNLKQTEIDRFYSPKYFGSQMSRQDILFEENMRILTHSKTLAESFTEEEYREHYDELREKGKLMN